MKLKKLASFALAGALTLGLLPAFSSPALAADGDTTYTLTIPSTLTVANSGWNATDGISATGTLASGKKLTVTASSANSWALKQQDGSETVSYTMKETSDGAAKTAWEFTALPGNATLGIDVADYSSKPAGTYQDTVTFTAKVEDNLVSFTVKRVTGVNWNYTDGNYTVAAGTTWQQFIESGNAPACLSIYNGYVRHDMNNSIMDCGGTNIANTADKKRVKPSDVIIDGATYGCSDYLGYQDHD